MMSATLELASELIACSSVTPDDAGCQKLIGDRLAALGFRLESMRFGDVDNLWARLGESAPLLCFAGHTDVVPTGPREAWSVDPFVPTVRDGMLYGRGAADMKGGLAAMVTACEAFLKESPTFKGSIAFLLTSDEEGPSIDGTVRVIEALEKRGEKIDWCIVGEPSSEHRLGDIVRNGRRGSLTGRLRVRGKQGHVAYPHLAANPVHIALPALAALAATVWDEGNAFFPATSFQVVEVNAGAGANNIIPGTMDATFNFRFSTEATPESLKTRVEAILRQGGVKDFDIQWTLHGSPFLTSGGPLVEAVQAAIKSVAGIETMLSTGGGTSDGRFIAPTGASVIELGPRNATIHQVDECVGVDELDELSRMYEHVLGRLLRG
jgi:succinyl-diaminopimelate desuccinylase